MNLPRLRELHTAWCNGSIRTNELEVVDPPVGARSDCVGSGGLRLPGNMTEFLDSHIQLATPRPSRGVGRGDSVIIEAEAKVELDKYELESTQTLIRKFVEQKHIVTSVELVSMDEHLRSWDGVMFGVERVGLRVKIVAHGKAGAKAIAELLESLGAKLDASDGDVTGIDGCSCEPSAMDLSMADTLEAKC